MAVTARSQCAAVCHWRLKPGAGAAFIVNWRRLIEAVRADARVICLQERAVAAGPECLPMLEPDALINGWALPEAP